MVTNETCITISKYCPKLTTLDLSRCLNLRGHGVRRLFYDSFNELKTTQLKELRLGGLRQVTDDMMRTLGRAAPFLEVLDLSCCRDLHNSSIEAFVSLSEDDLPSFEFEWVQLTSREAGRDPSDYTTQYWRRITQLRHLNLSSCSLLTDHACSHLAHAVPKLEFLELANIGPELGDEGLVRLVKTTPKPRATKKRSGELGPFLLPSSVGVAVGPEVVEEGKRELVEVAMLMRDRETAA